MKLLKLLFLPLLFVASLYANSVPQVPMHEEAEAVTYKAGNSLGEMFAGIYQTTGLNAFLNPIEGLKNSEGMEIDTWYQS